MKKPVHKAIKLYLAACSFAPCMVSLAGVCLLVDVDFAAESGTTDVGAESLPLECERVIMGDLKTVMEIFSINLHR